MSWTEEGARQRGIASVVRAMRLGEDDEEIERRMRLLDGVEDDPMIGSVLGTACGDCLGSNLEFMSADEIKAAYGRVQKFLHSARRPRGSPTDDTEMTVALVDSLVRTGGRADAVVAARCYAEYALQEPRRGYGPSVMATLVIVGARIACEEERGPLTRADVAELAEAQHSGGSWANGCLMRIGPAGVAFRAHLAADDGRARLRDEVRELLLCTHVSDEAVDAATALAWVCARLALDGPGSDDQAPRRAFTAAASTAEHPRVRSRLLAGLAAAQAGTTPVEALPQLIEECPPFGRLFAIRASDALGVVSFAICRRPHEPDQCLLDAINWGGDADTIGAIIGAVLGAWRGTRWIQWWTSIEDNGPLSLTRLVSLSKQVSAISVRQLSREHEGAGIVDVDEPLLSREQEGAGIVDVGGRGDYIKSS